MRYPISNTTMRLVMTCTAISILLMAMLLLFWQYHIQCTKKSNQYAIDFFETLILRSQKHDEILVVPVFLCHPNQEMFRSHDMLRHIKGKNKINKIVYVGLFPPKFDQESLSYILSLKDLSEMTLAKVRLEGHLFNHTTQLPPIKCVTIENSHIDKEGYQDLISINTLNTLTIFSLCTIIPDKEGTYHMNKNISNIKRQEIVDVLSTASNLRYLLLDESFSPWENELRSNLPNTDIQILCGVVPLSNKM